MTTSPDVTGASPLDLVGPDAVTNPYPGFARLRREAPVSFIQAWGGWAVTRYKDVVMALRDARLSSDRRSGYERQMPAPIREKLEPLFRNLTTWMVAMDPPAHTRIRALINQAFHPRLIEGMRPKVQRIADKLLAPAEASGTMDIIRDYADLLPVHVMADVLGLPEESRPRLKQWSKALASFLGGSPSLPLAESALHAVAELEDYFRAQIAERRRQPREDLLTSMIAAAERGTFLSEHEIVSTSTMLLFGGHETTTYLIGNGVLALLENPSQEAILRASPDLIAPAVEEFLRYESPVKRMRRMALEDIEIEGVLIKKGDLVFPVVASANRDPDQFPDPDRLDVRRSDVRHLALGLGLHYCVGASLVRLEGQIAFESLLRRFPRIERAWDRLCWIDNSVARGVELLPVKVSVA